MISDFLRLIRGFILIIGPSEAGKTSILRRLITGEFENQRPTLGYRDENIKKVRIIEIGGQSDFRRYWKIALDQNPNHVFFVIDVTKKNDYTDYQEFLDGFPEFLDKSTLTINKMDLIETLPDYLSDTHPSIQCSAKNGRGMLDILETIANFRDVMASKTTQPKAADPIEEEKEKAESILKEYQGKF